MEDRVYTVEIQENMSREQEKAAIGAFYNALPAGSYLKEILKGLPQYCEEQITNDWTMNPIETIRINEQVISDKDKYIKGMELEVKNIMAQFAAYSQSNTEYLNDLHAAHKALDIEKHDNSIKEGFLQLQRQEILSLKAKLYDCMIKERG